MTVDHGLVLQKNQFVNTEHAVACIALTLISKVFECPNSKLVLVATLASPRWPKRRRQPGGVNESVNEVSSAELAGCGRDGHVDRRIDVLFMPSIHYESGLPASGAS